MDYGPIDKQIETYFSLSTIPVYVPGIDIHLRDNEIIYTATKGHDTFKFVVRNGMVHVTNFYHNEIIIKNENKISRNIPRWWFKKD